MASIIPSDLSNMTKKELNRRKAIESGTYHPKSKTGKYNNNKVAVDDQTHTAIRFQLKKGESMGSVVRRWGAEHEILHDVYKNYPEIREKYAKIYLPDLSLPTITSAFNLLK